MGTLFAFVLVCGGVLKMQLQPDRPEAKFRTPYLNAKFIYPLLLLAGIAYLFLKHPDDAKAWVSNAPQILSVEDLLQKVPDAQIPGLQRYLAEKDSANFAAAGGVLATYLENLEADSYSKTVDSLPISSEIKYESGWSLFKHKIPMWLFIITSLVLAWLAFKHNLSLIPILGLVTCFYMMAEIPADSWAGFFIWLVIGLVIYFGYGYSNSKLINKTHGSN
jgi:hypothetical protein